MKKNLLKRAGALGLSVMMMSGITACGNGGTSTSSGDDEKPSKITMTATSIMTFENGLQLVCDKYKDLTGIELVVEKPDHNKYYEKVTLSFASENPSDVIEIGSTYYPEYANNGVLWDMTDAWDTTTAPAKSIVNEDYVDAIRIDGRLYGFPTVAGNGTITYVRQDWLDEAGLDLPTTYDEFIDMLRAFKARGNGAIPITAAGLINSETPYDIYLREFYQDAVPDFYIPEGSDKYVDGFSEDAMAQAMQRMRDAYAEGLIDAEIVTNQTSTCRDKLNSGLVGCFNYWAGMWNAKLEDATKLDDGTVADLVPMPPIEGVEYIERVPTAFVITNYADNPQAIFENLILYSHDGGEGQMLFTHGVEDSYAQEKGESKGGHYTTDENGETVALPYWEDPNKLVEKSFYAPELSITEWDDPIALDPRVVESLEVFQANRKFATVPIISDVISDNLANLNVVKGEVLANVVHGNMTVEEGLQDYQTRAGEYVEAILADLNGEG